MSLRIVLLALLLQTTPQVAPSRKSSVEGVVLRSGTNEPVEDVVVILAKVASDVEVSVTTDSQGRFAFKNLEAATYRLLFESIGYVRQEYGQRAFPGTGTPLNLADGQALGNLVVRLTPTGSVSGRIFDDDKQPLAGVPVRLMRLSYDEEGQKVLRPVGIRFGSHGFAQTTDDRGEYRLYFITPGRYYLNAGTRPGPSDCRQLRHGPNEVGEPYAYVYYPGVADLKFASVVDVQPGAEVSGIDLTLARTQLYRIRGRVIDTTTGQPPAKTYSWISGDFAIGSFGCDVYTSENGIFDFQNIAPGAYSVGASNGPPEAQSRRRSRVPVEVVNSDIDGIVLTLSAGVSLSGRVRIDGADSPMAAFIDDDAGVTLGGLSPGGWARLNADGTFRIDNVLPGEYRIYPRGFQPSFYIKEARFGGANVLGQPLHVAGQESGTLEILLSSNVGAIDGDAAGPSGLVPGAQVVLVPDKSRHRHDLFRAVTADQNGRFSIPYVAPGDYKLFAWETIEPYSWFDAEVLGRYEFRARSIHVTERSRQTIEVRTLVSTP